MIYVINETSYLIITKSNLYFLLWKLKDKILIDLFFFRDGKVDGFLDFKVDTTKSTGKFNELFLELYQNLKTFKTCSKEELTKYFTYKDKRIRNLIKELYEIL